jgi:hypothetical protein
MVSKAKKGSKRGRVEVGKLKLNRETMKDLSTNRKKQIKGGVAAKCACYDPLTSRKG